MSRLAQLISVPVLAVVALLISVGLIAVDFWWGQEIDRQRTLSAVVANQRLAAQRLPRWVLELPVSPGIAVRSTTLAGLGEDLDSVEGLVKALQDEGAVTLSSGKTVTLSSSQIPAEAQPASAVLAEAWSQLQPLLQPLRAVTGQVDRSLPARVAELSDALDAAFERLVEVIDAGTAQTRQQQSLVLAVGLGLLALLFAAMIWMHRRQAESIERARRESMEMLAAVPVGLFTLDQDYRLGDHYSPQLTQMFGSARLAQRNLVELLRELMPDDLVDTAKEFISLLFSERVNENLISSLNPLDRVEIGADESRGGRRFLDFAFARVRENGKVVHLLVTVTDITERVVLSEELDRLRSEGDAHNERLMEVVVGLLKADRQMIDHRMQHWRVALKEANQALKQSARGQMELRRLIDRVFRPVHLIKGESAAMGLGFILQRAKSTELELGLLRDRENLEGNDFLPVAVRLEDLFGQLDVLERMLKQLGKLTVASADGQVGAAPKPVRTQSFVEQLVAGLAGKLGRQVRVVVDGKGSEALPDARRTVIDDIVGQLARNAMAHGLESSEERARLGKSPVGEIRYGVNATEDAGLELSFRDDGRGIDLETLRRRAVASRRFSPEQAAKMDGKQLMGLIFLPGFSTYGAVDDAAGRGVGLDIVAETVKRLGGRIGVHSVPGQFTQFRIRLPGVVPASGVSSK